MQYEKNVNNSSLLTLIEVLVSIAGSYLRGELVPQAMQLPLDGIEARHCGLEEARLNDAHVNSKVAYIPPEDGEHIEFCINNRSWSRSVTMAATFCMNL